MAFGALGTPIIALQGVTELDLFELSAMVGRQLPFFSLIVPFWLIWAFAGWRGMLAVWPAILVAGVSFAVLQFLVSNYHGPWLVDILAAIGSMAAVVLVPAGLAAVGSVRGADDGTGSAPIEQAAGAAARATSSAPGCRG